MSVDLKHLEGILLNYENWMTEHYFGCGIGSQKVTAKRMITSVERATQEQRNELVRILNDKFGISSRVESLESCGHALIVETNGPFHDADKLRVAQEMNNPVRWAENSIQKSDGRTQKAMNLSLGNPPDPDHIKFAQDWLKKAGIESTVVHSKSLGNIDVIRIVGDQDIAKLNVRFPASQRKQNPSSQGKGDLITPGASPTVTSTKREKNGPDLS